MPRCPVTPVARSAAVDKSCVVVIRRVCPPRPPLPPVQDDAKSDDPKKARVDPKVLGLRQAVIAELTPMLTWEYLQKNKTPNGTLVSVRGK